MVRRLLFSRLFTRTWDLFAVARTLFSIDFGYSKYTTAISISQYTAQSNLLLREVLETLRMSLTISSSHNVVTREEETLTAETCSDVVGN